MPSRILAVAALTTAALAAAATLAGSAGASSMIGRSPTRAQPAGVASVSSQVHGLAAESNSPRAATPPCYVLTTGNTGSGVLSANFSDTGFDIYDSVGAVDVTLKKACTITSVTTIGLYFKGSGPANSVNVLVYQDHAKAGAHRPGELLTQQRSLPYKDSTGLGDLAPKLKKPIVLKKGRYWVAVVANMTFANAGEWGWGSSTQTVGLPDLWENPGGGLDTCTTWGEPSTCFPGSGLHDFLVTLGS